MAPIGTVLLLVPLEFRLCREPSYSRMRVPSVVESPLPRLVPTPNDDYNLGAMRACRTSSTRVSLVRGVIPEPRSCSPQVAHCVSTGISDHHALRTVSAHAWRVGPLGQPIALCGTP